MLKVFIAEFNDWLNAGLPEHKVFEKHKSLCENLGNYCASMGRTLEYENGLITDLHNLAVANSKFTNTSRHYWVACVDEDYQVVRPDASALDVWCACARRMDFYTMTDDTEGMNARARRLVVADLAKHFEV